LVADPIGTVKGIYEHHGLDLTDLARRRMAAWMAANPQDRHGRHRYRAEDFALEPGAIRERFAAYCDRFEV
jgi:hypothetical protein